MARRHQRREIARCSTADKDTTRILRQSRDIGDPSQRLIFRIDCTGALEPAARTNVRRTDDEIKKGGDLGGCRRDESQIAWVILRDAGGCQRLNKEFECSLTP